MDPTPIADLDRMVDELNAHKEAWVTLDPQARIDLLQACMDATLGVAEEWVRGACRAKGLSIDSPASSEEWLGGPMTTLRNLRLLVESLDQIREFGRPQLAEGAIRTRHDGQLKVAVFPRGTLDKLMYASFRADVWMEPDVDETELLGTMARIYRDGYTPEPKVALVLGAGNVSSIGPMDVLHKLFIENQVCLLKMNPVNEYTGPYVARGFAPLVERGFLRVAYGGAAEGSHLVHHDGIDEVHITGSDFVHDIIVWGAPGDEQERNKQAGTPILKKRITSELGCVTPVIVVPGNWTEKELDFQAASVATMVANNGSFNCNAAKVILTSEAWPQRQAFLSRVEGILGGLPVRQAYYPGSDKKYQAFLDAHPDARVLGKKTESVIPWTTIFGVDPEQTDDVVFTKEAWCAVIAESALPGDTARDFLATAVEYANENVWGTLSCVVIAHPKTQRELGDAFEQALADLRYGGIGVNCWSALCYGLVYTTWGAYPGHTLEDIRSGIGVVHNSLMLERPQKSIIYAPFTMFPKPPWFATNKNAHRVGPKITKFEHTPSVLKTLGIAFSALRG